MKHNFSILSKFSLWYHESCRAELAVGLVPFDILIAVRGLRINWYVSLPNEARRRKKWDFLLLALCRDCWILKNMQSVDLRDKMIEASCLVEQLQHWLGRNMFAVVHCDWWRQPPQNRFKLWWTSVWHINNSPYLCAAPSVVLDYTCGFFWCLRLCLKEKNTTAPPFQPSFHLSQLGFNSVLGPLQTTCFCHSEKPPEEPLKSFCLHNYCISADNKGRTAVKVHLASLECDCCTVSFLLSTSTITSYFRQMSE